ncbi:hypothetical protein HHK36_022284 [Tetracentron sinense]|uniref:Uncharacterized protein n=1 Tax=Tetracentron sinense TaxID=13715 RepID=A0A834YMP6_TETSI|nr:hypothetical protein HHK36_022284 [Tetracentron sinense]
MSRCFPFPPPGYEKKTRTDDADLLTKEKQKEKRHKKDKRDEDKREGKEKKDKDRSKEKRREKKDQKEKHRDKKKDRDKDKNRSLDEKRIEGQPEGFNGEKLGQNSQSAEKINDAKFVQELGRRIRNGKREVGNQMVEKLAGTDQRRAEGMGRLLEDSGNWAEGKEKNKDKRGDDSQADGQRNRNEERSKGNAMVQNFIRVDQRSVEGMARPMEKDVEKRLEEKEKNRYGGVGDKFVQELGRRIRDDEKETGNQMVEKFTGTDQRRAEGMCRLLEKGISNCVEGREKNKDKRGDNRRASEQRNKDEERGMGNTVVQEFTTMDQKRVQGMVKSMEKDVEKRMEGKEKNKDKEGGEKQRDKHKDRDRDKKSKGKDKDKDRDREKKKEKEKVKEKSDHINKEGDKLRERGAKAPIDAVNMKPSQLPKHSDNSATTKGNLGKRKNFEMNGFLHDNDVRPTKLPRPASSTHPFTENGRTFEQCSTGIQFASNRQVTANNCKLDNKNHKVNGVIEAQSSSVDSTRPAFTTVQANVNAPSTKPPHPDFKYLSQILSVPKMEECPDFDDQEWLFSCDNIQSKKTKAGSTRVSETSQVWAEALQIELADICALPYVIPY